MCLCDDQVMLNEYMLQNYVWDRTTSPRDFIIGGVNMALNPPIPVAKELDEVYWGSLTAIDNRTGNRIEIWDRNYAYRAFVDGSAHGAIDPPCPLDMERTHVVMPTSKTSKSKLEINTRWLQTCWSNNTL
jgi:hypothetical protein